MRYTTHFQDQDIEITLERELTFGVEQLVSVGDKELSFELVPDQTGYLLRVGNKLFRITDVEWDEQDVRFLINGFTYTLTVKDERDQLLEKLGFSSVQSNADGLLKAPMPGKVLSILVSAGDEVEVGQPLVILEAMKMENELKAPVSGVIGSFFAQPADSVEKNQPILEITTRG